MLNESPVHPNILIESQLSTEASYLGHHSGAEVNSLAPEQQGWTRLASRSLFARCECDSRCMFVSLVPGVLHHNVSGKGSSTHVTRRSSDRKKKATQNRMLLSSHKRLKNPRCRPRCFISLFYSLKCCQVLWDKCNWKWSGQHPEPPTDRMNASSAVN